MPRISEFFGIEIYMSWRDHPPPHFHAYYGGGEVTISITDLSVLAGSLPPRATGLIMEWAAMHQGQLESMWDRATNLEPLGRIDPLR